VDHDRAKIALPAASIPPFTSLLELPTVNPQASGFVEVTGYPGWGLRLEFRDPWLTRYYTLTLVADGAPADAFPEDET